MKQFARWNDIPLEQISDTVNRQVVWGDRATLCRITLVQGTHVSPHRHASEQYMVLLEGSLKVRVERDQHTMQPGDVVVIPSNAVHEVWTLEDAVVMDFFAPAREDWREKPSFSVERA